MPEGKATKRQALRSLPVQHFKPVLPTFIPISGIARVGAGHVATPTTVSFMAAVRQRGLRRGDAVHITNAHFHKCVASLTEDDRFLRKQEAIRGLTALRLERPEVRVR